MRIICTVTNDLSHDQRMIRICNSLQSAGYDVCLVGRELPDSPTLYSHAFRQYRLRCWFHKGKLFYLEYQLRLLYYLSFQSVDVINSVDLDTLLPGYLVSRWRKIPCVYDAHEYFTETPEVARRPAVQYIWSVLANWIIPKLTYCYTVGPKLAEILSEKYGVLFGIVRNVPVRKKVEVKPIDKSSAEKILLYQGMLNEGRGLEVAVKAMTGLPNEFVLWLVGKGDIKTKLEAEVQRLGLNQRVRFWGFMPPTELPPITQQAWLGLNLLESRSLSYYYSLANKAFDYIQAGIPAIHMDFPEYRALQEEWKCFGLLNKLDATNLAQLIQRMANTPQTYAELIAQNQLAAAHLHWQAEEKELLKIYQHLVLKNKGVKG